MHQNWIPAQPALGFLGFPCLWFFADWIFIQGGPDSSETAGWLVGIQVPDRQYNLDFSLGTTVCAPPDVRGVWVIPCPESR